MEARPLADQGLGDVLRFLEQGIGENLTLDYKRGVSPEKPKDNAELCKDISALANSAGGTILYGVAEQKPQRTPELPPHGIPRYHGRQPVEEWAAQVLASGVQPPMDVEIGVYDLGEAGDDPTASAVAGAQMPDLGREARAERCVMAMRVPASPGAPHMVVSAADNRYYGRFYRRSNYESRIAQEYEVREMLERARRLYEGVEGEVGRRGYGDPGSSDFANNQYARRLVTRFSHRAEAGNEEAARRVTVLLLPVPPVPSSGAARQDRRAWVSWLDPNARRYPPDLGAIFVPSETRQPTLGGIACQKNLWEHDGSSMQNRGLQEYLLVGFDGAVELGFSDAVRQRQDWGMTFVISGGQILARAWQTINFAADVRRSLGLASSYLLVLNAKNTAHGILIGFASGWKNLDPSVSAFVEPSDVPHCLETNLQIRRELGPEDFEEISCGTWESPPDQIRELADELSAAFGVEHPVLLPREGTP